MTGGWAVAGAEWVVLGVLVGVPVLVVVVVLLLMLRRG